MSDARVMGYARVSSTGQNLDRQILALRKYVPEENIIVDKQSGKDLERPGLIALKGPLGLRNGDILYVKSLDRLSRNKRDIKNELQWFRDNGITIRIIDLPTTMTEFGEAQEWIQDMVTNILIEGTCQHCRTGTFNNKAKTTRRHRGGKEKREASRTSGDRYA